MVLNKSVLDKPVTKAEIDDLGLDHGGLVGLSDDDHPQYTLEAEAIKWAMVFGD